MLLTLFTNFTLISDYLPLLMFGENLIISICYFIIGTGIAYGIWSNRKLGINPVIVTIFIVFYSCAFGHGMHSLGMLNLKNTLAWQTVFDLITVLAATRFLSYYESFDILARISQIVSAKAELESQNLLLNETLDELKKTQSQLIQAEKMSSLGQLVAGIAHEINNPVSFIHGNLSYLQEYTEDLLSFVKLYQQCCPNSNLERQLETEEIELSFIQEDLPKIMSSMRVGTERIKEIVLSLRSFSHMDEAEFKEVNIHEGLDSTLLIVQHRLKPQAKYSEIEVIKDYGHLPLVECYGGLLNQVFMNILANAIDALEEASLQPKNPENIDHSNQITIRTSLTSSEWVEIAIADTGSGISPEVKQHIFDPFFTTKPVGKGTGMGMSISYQIITEKHGGKLECFSTVGKGTMFFIKIPVRQGLN
ncbi:MAG: ATP-binding protein [Cyanobacteria bacterium J06592_8]